jgi:hypothetical protein
MPVQSSASAGLDMGEGGTRAESLANPSSSIVSVSVRRGTLGVRLIVAAFRKVSEKYHLLE